MNDKERLEADDEINNNIKSLEHRVDFLKTQLDFEERMFESTKESKDFERELIETCGSDTESSTTSRKICNTARELIKTYEKDLKVISKNIARIKANIIDTRNEIDEWKEFLEM